MSPFKRNISCAFHLTNAPKLKYMSGLFDLDPMKEKEEKLTKQIPQKKGLSALRRKKVFIQKENAMLRPMGRLFLTVAVAGGLLLLAPLFKAANIGGVAYAQTQNPFQNAYFDDSVGGGTVSIVNPTEVPAVCALIYVFDAHEQLQECCGCVVTHSGGLRTIRIATQLSAVGFSSTPPVGPFNTLTDNPFDNVFLSRGVIKIISSLPNGKGVPCDPTAAADPVDALRASGTAFQVSEFNPTGGADDTDVIGVTEHKFAGGPDPSVPTAGASESESAALQDLCVGVQEFGSGQGVCGCGVGDVTPH